jgi:hypothetical protein
MSVSLKTMWHCFSYCFFDVMPDIARLKKIPVELPVDMYHFCRGEPVKVG